MNHIDLFSGIGGFSLAARNVWGKQHNVVAFCEINRYAQQVLKKHWPVAPICEDIRRLNYEFIANSYGIGCVHGKFKKQPTVGFNEAQRKFKPGSEPSVLSAKDASHSDIVRLQGARPEKQTEGNRERFKIDLLTGGFPCQPFSNAGKKRGTDDERYLWPEMLRVIKEFKPRWIVGENVAGLTNMAEWISDVEVEGATDFFDEEAKVYERMGRGILNGICDDIENEGYDVQAFIIPACAVNAPHRRDRIWIVAHSTESGLSKPGQAGVEEFQKESRGGVYHRPEQQDSDDSNPDSTGLQGVRLERNGAGPTGLYGVENPGWEENWLEVATKFCGVDDGLPVELDGFKLSKSKHREERLKGLGNAIVPAVAEEIFKAIKEVDPQTRTLK